MPLTIPKWVPPAARLNGQNNVAATQVTINADGQPIPLAYGPVQIGGRIFAIDYTAGIWTVGALFCLGEINRFVQIYLDGAVPSTDVVINTYVGSTSQTVDPLLEAALGTEYNDDLVISHPSGDVGIAYCVIQYAEAEYTAPPAIIAEIEGKLLEDPDNPSGPLYSEDAALMIRDLVTAPQYGLGDSIDDTTVTAAVAANAETVITEARRLTGIVLDRPQETLAWIEILSAYAGCWTFKRGATWVLVPDRDEASAPVRTITAADILAGSMDISLADPSDVPTVVRIAYTDQTPTIWREREAVAQLAGVDVGTVPTRESYVRLPGVFRYSQAYREATERLNKLQHRLSASFVLFDENIDLEVGDIISVTHPYGLTAAAMRIVEPPRILRPGRLAVTAIEYDATDYDDSEEVPNWTDGSATVGDGSNQPEPGSTLGAAQNLMPYGLADFESLAVDQLTKGGSSGGAIAVSTEQAWLGNKSVKVTAATGSNKTVNVRFSNSVAGNYNIPVIPGRRYLVIVSVYPTTSEVTDGTMFAKVFGSSGAPSTAQSTSQSLATMTVNAWNRIAFEIDATATTWPRQSVLLEWGNTGTTTGSPIFYLDGLVLLDVTDHPGLNETNYPAEFVPAAGPTVGSFIFEQGQRLVSGVGTPEHTVSAVPGSIYSDGNGGLWVKETGSGDDINWAQLATEPYADAAVAAAQYTIYDSGQQTISSSASGSWSHGLSATPQVMVPVLEATATSAGYSSGDRVPIPITVSSTTDAGINVWASSSSIGYIRSAVIHLPHKTTGVATSITLTSWRLRVFVIY